MKLLIVDDHAGMRRVIRQTCKGVADEIFESASGEEAVQVFLRHHPDWVIMDLRMPVMDGFAATRAILREAPGARIIITSQLQGPELRDQSIEAGAVDFVSKDSLSQLVDIIRSTPTAR